MNKKPTGIIGAGQKALHYSIINSHQDAEVVAGRSFRLILSMIDKYLKINL